MSGADGLVSCVGGCNSKSFNSRRVYRPLVNITSQKNLRLHEPREPLPGRFKQKREIAEMPPIFNNVPNVKKSRKRRDRKAAGTPQATTAISIERHSDDAEETPKRSRPLAVRFMFWFCGIWIVIIGAGALLYAIVIFYNSMDKIKNFFQTFLTVDPDRMFTDSWRTKEFLEHERKYYKNKMN